MKESLPASPKLRLGCRFSWRHRIVARYFRAAEHPGRLRLLRWLKRLLGVGMVRAEVFPGVVMDLDESDYVNREILLHGGYELATLALFDRLICDARGFLDIGAHHGQYSLRAARRLAARGGRVAAFEPMPPTAAKLLHNAALSGLTNIDCYSFALSDAGSIAFIVQSQDWNSGGSRVLASNVADGAQRNSIHVAVRPFAEVAPFLPLEAFDLVKLDIEGHEARVLTSLFNTLQARPKHLIVEFTPLAFAYAVPGGLPAWLSNFGYTIRTVTGEAYAADGPLPDSNLWAELRQ